MDLVPLVSSPSWQFDKDQLWRLPGAHGDEVVRSVYVDEQVSCPDSQRTSIGLMALQSTSVFTCGEDGFVRAWKPCDEQEPQSAGASVKPRKQKKADRYKPY